jgi:hypothetical protein
MRSKHWPKLAAAVAVALSAAAIAAGATLPVIAKLIWS